MYSEEVAIVSKQLNEDDQIREAYGESIHESKNGLIRTDDSNLYKSDRKVDNREDNKLGSLEDSPLTQYNPGSAEVPDDEDAGHTDQTATMTLAVSKTRKMKKKSRKHPSTLSAKKTVSQEEVEFKRLRDSHNNKLAAAKNNSSMTVRRHKASKLIINRTQSNKSSIQRSASIDSNILVKPKNPPVPRFAHPPADGKATDVMPLIEKPKKKPRPEPVPEN